MPSGFGLSLLMHVGVILIIAFGFPILFPKQTDYKPTALSVELVPIKEFTNLKNSKHITKKPAPAKKPKKPVPKTRTEAKQPEPKKDAVPLPDKPKKPAPKKPKPKDIKPKPKKQEKDDFAVLMSKLKQDDASEKTKKKPEKKAEDGDTSKSDNYNPSVPLSMSETDAIRSQFAKCWRMPAGARNDYSLAVVIRLQLARDGRVLEVGLVPNQLSRYQSDTFFRAAADSAIRAARACSPLRNLPPNKYDTWRDMTVNFDPQELLY